MHQDGLSIGYWEKLFIVAFVMQLRIKTFKSKLLVYFILMVIRKML